MKTIFGIAPIDEYLDLLRIDKSPNTIKVYCGAIEKFIEYFNANNFNDIERITPGNMRSFQSNLKTLGLSFSSINTNMRPLKAMFNWLIENEYLEKSPMEKVKSMKCPKKVLPFLTEEEQEKMIGACKTDLDTLIVAIFLSTGLRRNELSSLTLGSYDGTHILVEGKGSKQRKLILQPEITILLNRYIKDRNHKYGNKTDALLVSKMGCHFSGDGIYKKIKTILHNAGLPEDRIETIHVHSLRHSFVANLLNSGADIYTAQKSLGHANLSTTMIYSHLSNQALDRSMLNQKSIL